MGKIYKDDVGTEIILDCETDITNALSFIIKVRKPDKTEVEWVAELKPNETTKMRYFIQEGDLDQKGKYFVQAYPDLDTWQGRGETAEIIVYDHYK